MIPGIIASAQMMSRAATPTTFAPVLWNGNGTSQAVNVGFSPDLVISKRRASVVSHVVVDNVRGATVQFNINGVSAESTVAQGLTSFDALGFSVGTDTGWNATSGGTAYVGYCFEETAGFFDIVTYTGTGSARTVAHSLGVAPEMIWVKTRSGTGRTEVYAGPVGATKTSTLNSTTGTAAPNTSSSAWNNTAPTSSNFTVGNSTTTNASGATFVAYLFASLAGRSSIGSYTGNGSASGPSVTCGFAPSFVLIKRTDSASSWGLFDTARDASPINTSSFLEASAAEATQSYDVTIDATGFHLTNAAASDFNVSGGTYLYMAIR